MAKSKKKVGISKDDLTKFLLNNVMGAESLALNKQASELETPQTNQSNMVNQFGAAGLTADTRKLLGQLGLYGQALAKSNVSDLLGFKDVAKFSDKGNPIDALYAAMSVIPFSGGKLFKKTGATGAKYAGGMIPNDVKNLWKLLTSGQND